MGEITKEQVAAVSHQATVEGDHLTLALVRAYEECQREHPPEPEYVAWCAAGKPDGAEVERLRADLRQAQDTNNDLTVRGGSAMRRAEQSEARLREVVEAGRAVYRRFLLRAPRWNEGSPMLSDKQDLDAQKEFLAALAAAQPEEGSRG